MCTKCMKKYTKRKVLLSPYSLHSILPLIKIAIFILLSFKYFIIQVHTNIRKYTDALSRMLEYLT